MNKLLSVLLLLGITFYYPTANAQSEAPSIKVEPANVSCAYGATAAFNVTAQGSGLFGYQWYQDGFALGNGVGVTGVLTATLTVGPAQPVHDGNYFVVVTNAFGSATSHVAKLYLLPEMPVKKMGVWPHSPEAPLTESR